MDWISPKGGLRWLDVGCGSGALSEAVVNKHKPKVVTAIDQSEGFVRTAQERLGNRARCEVGNALSLPLNNSSVDITISGLVLNFIPEPAKALAEMKRVTKKGGSVAGYIWDYAGKMDFLNYFWDVAVELDRNASDLHEGRRFPKSNAEELTAIFRQAGFVEVDAVPVEIATNFIDFNDYWRPFLGGQGPAPSYVLNLKESERNRLRDSLIQRLPIKKDGSIPLFARAWAAKGIV